MGVVPAFLLRHTVTVEAYLGIWNAYAPPRSMRCFVAQKVRGTRRRYVTLTIITRPDEVCPDGSRITLADGTKGYVSTATVNEGGGLPTPDNMEIAVTLPEPSYGPPLGGEPVVILRRTQVAEDSHHNPVYRVDEITVHGCAVTPTGSNETDTGSRDQTVDVLSITMPPDTDVKRFDQLRVRGLIYDVDGTPDNQHDPDTGGKAGVQLVARRVTG